MSCVVYRVYVYAFCGVTHCVHNVCLVMYIMYVYVLCCVIHRT